MLTVTSISDFISCIFLATIFVMLTELKYSKKATYISVATFVLLTFSGYIFLVSRGVNNGTASALILTIPSLLFCFLISKNKDSRFVFTYSSIDIMGLIIIILARSFAILFDDNPVIILTLTLAGFSFFLYLAGKYRNNYLRIQKDLSKGWRSLAAVSLLFYIMIYMIVAYPVPMIERREYVPVAVLFSITVMVVYVVIYQTIMRAVAIHDEKKNKALLEMEIKLQKSELELKEMYYKMAYTDMMTGLKNRTAFEERKRKLNSDIKNGKSISCLLLDLNNLKETNDSLGHDQGDVLLKALSEILKKSFAELEEVYRIGGDEFVILFSGIPVEDINRRIRTIKKEIELYNKCKNIIISVAMGFASLDDKQIKDLNSLMMHADEKMYKNKQTMKKLETALG